MSSTKKKRKDDKRKSPPEDVAVNHPLDANPISEGAIPPKKAKKKKNTTDEAQKEMHVERKQPKGAIVVAQHTDGVAIRKQADKLQGLWEGMQGQQSWS